MWNKDSVVIQLKAYWEVGTVHCTHSAATPPFFQSMIAIRLEMPQKRYGLQVTVTGYRLQTRPYINNEHDSV